MKERERDRELMLSHYFGCAFIALVWLECLTQTSLASPSNDQYIYNYYERISTKTVTINSMNEQSLVSELDGLTSNDKSSPMIVMIRTTEARESLALYLEHYLEPRPWWRFQQWLKIEQEEVLVLDRAPVSYESDLRDLIQSHYIPSSQCSSKHMDAIYVGSDTWGNRLLLLNTWVSGADINSVQGIISLGRVNFVEESECKEVNRWNCLFFRSTNCNTPTVALSVTNNDKRGFYYPATESALLATTPPEKAPRPSHGSVTAKVYDIDIVNGQVSSSPPRHAGQDANPVIRTYGILTRFNVKFSQQVQRQINDFRHSFSPPFDPNVSCVALHIRRNDRSIRHMDGPQIKEFCASRSKYDENTGQLLVDESKKWHDEKGPMSHGRWMDLGCHLKVPYGAATFEHFFNASLILDPDIKNIFVMTDDRVALAKDITQLTGKSIDVNASAASHIHFQHKGVNVYNYAASLKHRDRTMDSSAEFWSAIRIAQQCKGFVAYHESSAAAKMINLNMCSYHDGQYKSCPSLFNFAVRRPSKEQGK